MEVPFLSTNEVVLDLRGERDGVRRGFVKTEMTLKEEMAMGECKL